MASSTNQPTLPNAEVLVLYQDKMLTCRECGREFVFTAGEQEFYASRGLMNQPGRCPECRAVRRQRMNVSGGSNMAMEDRSQRPQREMHPAVCAECGAQTMVPFLPRNDKPVYCSSCYDRVRARR
jgi:CxxC-x17-CxxC domain-containing protein